MTTWSVDADVYLRATLAAEALVRVNALRAKRSIAATTLEAYREEAQRLILVVLAGRGISEGQIAHEAALVEPEALLAATLVFEAASVRDDAVGGLPDVFAAQARVYRGRYNASMATANPLGQGTRPRGRTFSWGRC